MKMQWLDLDDNGGIVKEELLIRRDPLAKFITGEASANTFAQVPPIRLKQAYPDAKLILCLRHPVDRAYSHYRMLQRFAHEGRRIPFHPIDFVSDFKDDLGRVQWGEQGYFAGVSFYTTRLKRWAQIFEMENIYIVRTEDLPQQISTQRILSVLCHFLDIRDYDFSGVLQLMVNKAGEQELDPQLRNDLFEYFRKDVQELEEFTGRNFNWNP